MVRCGYFLLFFLYISKSYCNGKKFNFDLKFDEGFNLYKILEGLSSENRNENVYYKYWINKLGADNKDKGKVYRYKELKKEYEKNIAAKGVSFDEAFASYDKFNDSLKVIKYGLDSEKSKQLEGIFNSIYDDFKLIVVQKNLYSQKIDILEKALKKSKLKSHLRKATKFLKVDFKKKLITRFVWLPAGEKYRFSIDKNVISIFVPLESFKTEFLIRELAMIYTNFYLNQYESTVKKGLEEVLVKSCPLSDGESLNSVFFGPLSVALGSMSYKKMRERRKFDSMEDWSENHWTYTYSRILYPLVLEYLDKKKTIFQDFISHASTLCFRLRAASYKSI